MRNRLSRLLLALITVCGLDTVLPMGGSFGMGGPAWAEIDASAEDHLPRRRADTEYESYLVRPDILSVDPIGHELEDEWTRLIAGHHWMVALLLELYPDRHLYFLARDAEFLYDTARLALQGAEGEDRIHLINVSRISAHDWQLDKYLEQEGITEEALLNGKKIVFVDTGFAGTITRIIGNQYSERARANLSTHLIASENTRHPSTRSLLVHLNPEVNRMHPTGLAIEMVHFEDIYHYTEASERFRYQGGSYQPISPATLGPIGEANRELAKRYMQDLRSKWNPQLFKKMREEVRLINQLLTSTNVSQVQARLRQLLDHDRTGIREAVVRDIMDAQKNTGSTIRISLRDLQLSEAPVLPITMTSSSLSDSLWSEMEAAIRKPDTVIPTLFENQDFATIRALITMNISTEFNMLIANELFDGPAQGKKKELQVFFIERVNLGSLLRLASRVFSNESTAEMGDILQILVDHATPDVMIMLAQHVFSKPHSADKTAILQRLIDARDYDVHVALAKYAFSQPHTAGMTNLLGRLIDTASENWSVFFQTLVEHVFSQPHAAGNTDLLQRLIDKRNVSLNTSLIRNVFSKPHARAMEDLIVRMIETSNSMGIYQDLASQVFTQPHSGDMHRALKLLTERGDRIVLHNLVENSFARNSSTGRQILRDRMSATGTLRCEYIFW